MTPEQDPRADSSPGEDPDRSPAVAPGEGASAGSTEEPHQPDGLDLARAANRAAAAGPLAPATPRRKRRDGEALFREPRRKRGGGFSGAHPDERDPQLVGPTLDRLVARRGWELDLQVQGVFARWAELVGREVADHTTPESLSDGKLVVRTDSTAWATQLKLLAPTLVRRLNAELGDGTVLVIDVLGPHLPTWKKGPRSVRDGRGPRDTYG